MRSILLFIFVVRLNLMRELPTLYYILYYSIIVRGGPLDILGGGVSDPKKKFMHEIELEKKIPACA